MQAIILAAGMGKRLGAYTKDNTKCMVKVNGIPLIDRMLGQLAELGLERVVIVEGYKGAELKAHIGRRYDGVLKIEYINNPVYDRTNNIYSLALAGAELAKDDTLLLESDLIFEPRLLRMAIDDPHPNVALVAKYENWMDGTVVRIGDEMNIVDFITKKAFRFEDSASYYKTVNIYKFSKEFSRHTYLPFLDAYCKSMGDNEYYEQVLRVITFLDDSNLKALPIGDAKWYEIDDAADLDIAETLFADNEEMLSRFNGRYGGHWRFPKMLDFCYLVNPYFPPARMVDEMRNSFASLLTEYPSGMAVNSLLAGNCFHIGRKYVVAGNGASELIKSALSLLPGKTGIIFPTFEEYPHRLPEEAIVPMTVAGDGLRYDQDDIISFYDGKDIANLLLINPDNPSGNFIGPQGLEKLLEWSGRKGIKLIIDESFVDFSDDFEHNSLLDDSILEKYPNLLVMKSISKSYGVPGLRLGILACSDTVFIAKVRRDVSIWNINSFAEFFMQIFGKYAGDYRLACRKFTAERARFLSRLEQIPWLTVLPSQANFFCLQIRGRYTSHEVTRVLLADHGIMVKDCDSKTGLEGRNYIRVSIRNSADNDALVAALNEL
ncbi:MAG: aminotransferase class I/II-fold pyridoxal phosphate-dependent enzyme [Bacteroidales bacterium]|nr:aminotransferase class I/II-fold pyridoxal phosphate-dependent enzyme [Bacteroidales bacterium]